MAEIDDTDPLIAYADLKPKYGILYSRHHLARLYGTRFPAPFKIGNRLFWQRSTILARIAEQKLAGQK